MSNKVEINGTEFNACACECGEAVAGGVYRPGHDARHAGQVGRDMVRTGNTELVYRLPSQALRAKATRFYLKRVATSVPKTVKVGRWDYPARMTTAGKIERNTKRDGSGSWIAVEKKG